MTGFGPVFLACFYVKSLKAFSLAELNGLIPTLSERDYSSQIQRPEELATILHRFKKGF